MGNLPFRQVHLDFHTSEAIANIGSKFDKKDFQNKLLRGHVNSVTLFAKCHHGWAYHETTANEMHPGLNFDLLTEMIAACREIGVQTPVYISAGLDEKMARRHPEWLKRNRDETIYWTPDFVHPGYHTFCFNTPYMDYLVEQTKEVVTKFDTEGVFFDIVSHAPCYCQYCVAEMRNEGIDIDDYEAVYLFAERKYADYCNTLTKAVHDIRPNMRVFYNAGHIYKGKGRRNLYVNTHAEAEALPTGGWGYDCFPISARYLQGTGLEYLGMTGKFHTTWGEFGGYKHPNALKYETALHLANGAKSSIGDQMHPLGFLEDATYELIGAAYSEVEKKEPWCDDVESVADIAVLISEVGGKYNGKADMGAVRLLQEGKYLYDIVDEMSDISKYKVLILVDDIVIKDDFKPKINKFLEDGGKLLLTGASGVDLTIGRMIFDVGSEFIGENAFAPDYIVPKFRPGVLGIAPYKMNHPGYALKATNEDDILAYRQNPYFNRTTFKFCSHQNTPNNPDVNLPGITMGKDGIYISWPIFSEYAYCGSLICKETFKYCLDKLLGNNKTIITNLGAQGVVTLMKQPGENRYINHIVYGAPVKRGENTEIIEDLPTIYDTNVKIKLPEKVKGAYLAPSMETIALNDEGDGFYSFTVPKFTCHQMVVFDIDSKL